MMTRDSQKQSKGERYNAIAALRKLTFSIYFFLNFTYELSAYFNTVYKQDIHGSYQLNHIPVMDIVQPHGVNTMKVSECYPASLYFILLYYLFYLVLKPSYFSLLKSLYKNEKKKKKKKKKTEIFIDMLSILQQPK